MIIDFRLRPPFASFRDSFLFKTVEKPGHIGVLVDQIHSHIAQSALDMDMDELIKEMDESAIYRGVVPIRRSTGGNNDELLELEKLYPNRFLTLAGIDPDQPIEEELKQIDKYVNNGPAVGIALEPGYCKPEPLAADDRRLYPIYEKCEAENIPILLSVGGLCYPQLKYFKPEHVDNVCVDFPKIKLCLAHGGWPYVNEMCWITLKHENLWLTPDIYTFAGPGGHQYVEAMNGFMKDYTLFGSCYPIGSIADSIKFWMNIGIKKEYMPDIMGMNAARFLNLV